MSSPLGPSDNQVSKAALWSIYIALAAVGLAVGSGLGYRAGLWSVPVSIGVLGISVIAGGAALVVSGFGIYRSLRLDRAPLGYGYSLIGLMIAGGLILFLALQLKDAPNLPAIHDITTDTANPPNFVALLSVREASPNGAAYDYDARDEQIAAYPEILPLYIKGAKVAGATALAESQARKMGWEIAAIEPGLGRIEATDTTFWFGYKDDIIIRITAKEDGVMVDLRSVSRVGIGDLGANAKRIETFLSALSALKK